MLKWLLLLFPVFALAGEANLTWTAPTTNTDGSVLDDLTEYRIYRNQGAGFDFLTSTIEPYYLDNGLSTGDYDWHVTAVNSEGVESDPSNVASKSIFDDTGLPGKPIVYLAQGPPDPPMTAATVYIDFDNTDGGRDGSAEDPYNSIAEFQTARAETLDQPMHVYCSGDYVASSTTYIHDPAWGTTETNTLTLDGQGIATYTADPGQIRIEIANLIFENWTVNVEGSSPGITVRSGAESITLRNNIIIASATASNAELINIVVVTEFTFINNLVVLDSSSGVGNSLYVYDLGSGETVSIYNNTLENNDANTGYARCLYINGAGGGTVNVKNNILQSDGTYDCYKASNMDGITVNTASNITSDATSPDGSNWQNIELTFAGVDDYHLDSSDTEATDTGEDLSGTFTDDLEGTTRSNWSVGAYEYEDSEPTLIPSDGSHAHTADNVSLEPALIPSDAAHAHTADNVVLEPALIPSDAAHAHTADNLDLEPALIPSDAAHVHTADNVVLEPALIPADAAHVHTADNVVLEPALIPADAAHVHTADALVLEPALIPADAAHVHTADNVVLEPDEATLTPSGTAHAHTADNVVLEPDEVTLIPADAAHVHTADALVLEPALIPANAAHVHTADALVLEPALIPADAAHVHTADAPVLEPALIPADAAHAHTADALVLEPALIPSDASHIHTADNVELLEGLGIADAAHVHTADNVSLEPALIPSNASHAHTADNVGLRLIEHLYQGTIDQSASPFLQYDLVATVNPITGKIEIIIEDVNGKALAENIGITIGAGEVKVLGIQGSAHALTSANVVLDEQALVNLDTQSASHSLVSDHVFITEFSLPDLVIADAAHSLTDTDPYQVITGIPVYADAAEHVHTADNLTFQVSTPDISPDGGAVDSDQLVTITCGTGWADIYYTINGVGDPDSGDTLYDDGFYLPEGSVTVKAIGYVSGMTNSVADSEDFTVTFLTADAPDTFTFIVGEDDTVEFLTIAGSSHATTSEQVTLQDISLLIADATHIHTADNVELLDLVETFGDAATTGSWSQHGSTSSWYAIGGTSATAMYTFDLTQISGWDSGDDLDVYMKIGEVAGNESDVVSVVISQEAS